MAEILKGFLMIFPEWLAAIFMIAGLCVAMLAAVRLGYGLAVAKTAYKWIVNAEEKFGAGAGAERKLTLLLFCAGTPRTGWTGLSTRRRWTGSCRSSSI